MLILFPVRSEDKYSEYWFSQLRQQGPIENDFELRLGGEHWNVFVWDFETSPIAVTQLPRNRNV